MLPSASTYSPIFSLSPSDCYSRNSYLGSRSRLSCPLPPMVRALHFLPLEISALSSPIDSRRIVKKKQKHFPSPSLQEYPTNATNLLRLSVPLPQKHRIPGNGRQGWINPLLTPLALHFHRVVTAQQASMSHACLRISREPLGYPRMARTPQPTFFREILKKKCWTLFAISKRDTYDRTAPSPSYFCPTSRYVPRKKARKDEK